MTEMVLFQGEQRARASGRQCSAVERRGEEMLTQHNNSAGGFKPQQQQPQPAGEEVLADADADACMCASVQWTL